MNKFSKLILLQIFFTCLLAIPVSSQNLRTIINGAAKTILLGKSRIRHPASTPPANRNNRAITQDTSSVFRGNNPVRNISNDNIQDLTGTWKGGTTVDYKADIEFYLMKTGDYSYSGVSYTVMKKPDDNTPISDPRTLRRKMLFNATFTNNILSTSDYDTLEIHGLPSTFEKGSFELESDSGQVKLTEIGNKGYELKLIRTSTDFPEVYKKYLVKTTDQQANANGISKPNNSQIDQGNKAGMIGNKIYTGGKMYVNMEIIPEGKDKWKYLANGIFFVDNQNNVSGTIKSSRTYLGNDWVIPNHQELQGQVKGTYDPQNQQLHIQVFNNPNVISDIYDIALTTTARIKGKGRIKEKQTNIYRSVVGDFSATKVNVVASVPVDGNHDSRFIGRWTVNVQPGMHSNPVFDNTFIEFFSNGIGISRNERLNTRKNVRLFNWKVTDNNTINLLGSNYSFSLINDLLTLKTGASKKITLKRTSVNPFVTYKKGLTPDEASGNWIVEGRLRNEKIKYAPDSLTDPYNVFYDMHSFTTQLGEMVKYSFPDPMGPLSFDSLVFYKYEMETEANNDNPRGTLYSFTGMSAEDKDEFYCLQSDGVIILTAKNALLYLVKLGLPTWNDLLWLHNAYNAHYFHNILPPPHSHWVECTRCNGNGEVDDGEEEDYTYTNSNGYPVTVMKPKTTKCAECFGRGGWYVDDLTGERIAKMPGLFDLF